MFAMLLLLPMPRHEFATTFSLMFRAAVVDDDAVRC